MNVIRFIKKTDRENPVDKDGLYSGLILPPLHSNFILNLAWLSFFSGIYAISREHYTLAPVPLGVWATSLNYWRYPVAISIRRKVDIAYVHIGLIYQIYRSVNSQYAIAYWIIISITCAFFPLGIALNKYSVGLGTLCQDMVHIGGNIGNIVLYTGNISSL